MKRQIRIARALTVALPLLLLGVAVLRHYQPPDPARAFPAGGDRHRRGRQLSALCIR